MEPAGKASVTLSVCRTTTSSKSAAQLPDPFTAAVILYAIPGPAIV